MGTEVEEKKKKRMPTMARRPENNKLTKKEFIAFRENYKVKQSVIAKAAADFDAKADKADVVVEEPANVLDKAVVNKARKSKK